MKYRVWKKIYNKVLGLYDQHIWLSTRKKTKIEEKKMFFESFSAANFQGNVYYLFKYYFLSPDFKEFKFVIAAKEPNKIIWFLKKHGLYDQRVLVVLYLSKEYRKQLYSSKYLYNNVNFLMDFVKRDGQVYLNTWHGTPLKYIGKRANRNNMLVVQNMQRDFLQSDYLLSPNAFTTKVLKEDFNVINLLKNDILECGYPRNEIFYDEQFRNREREKLGLKNKKVIFYMPTWRDNKNLKVNFIEKMEQLQSRLDDSYMIYLKLHPLDSSDVSQMKNIYFMPEEYEVYEFLQCCDILITDYSSVFFDFANTQRKIILYQFDRIEYYNGRGIYNEVREEIPFPIVENIEELADEIQKDSCEYTDFIHKFCASDSKFPICHLNEKIFDIHPENEKVCNIVIVDRDDLDYRKIISEIVNEEVIKCVYLLIPNKKNHFFKNQSLLEPLEFVVGSFKGKYSLLEFLVLNIKGLQRISFFHRIRAAAVYREQKRFLGDLKVNKVYYISKVPDYLSNSNTERIF